MKERPIPFSGAMIRAILAGQKTQTRRVVKPQPHIDAMGNFCWDGWNFGQDFNGPHIQAIASPIPSGKTGRVHCPYGKPGDRLWVREAWRTVAESNDLTPRDLTAAHRFWYEADAPHQLGFGKLRPSIHMPRIASRILLEVVSVRVERLQDISEADAEAEGITTTECLECDGWANAYSRLWDSIYGEGSWAANPWVWVVEFKRIEGQPR